MPTLPFFSPLSGQLLYVCACALRAGERNDFKGDMAGHVNACVAAVAGSVGCYRVWNAVAEKGGKFVKAWENRGVVMRLRLLMSLWPCSLYLCVVETAVIQRSWQISHPEESAEKFLYFLLGGYRAHVWIPGFNCWTFMCLVLSQHVQTTIRRVPLPPWTHYIWLDGIIRRSFKIEAKVYRNASIQ